MRRRMLLAMAAVTAMLAALPMTAASAVTHDVLTTGKVGGPNVKAGAIIEAPLKAGTKATFFGPGTTQGVTCTKAMVTDKVVTNPAAPGTAVESLTEQTFSSCTTNIPGATSVKSVTVLNLPYRATVSVATGFPVTLTKPAGVLKTKISLNTVIGTITCTYSKTKLSGTASNAGQTDTFKNQVFALSSGPSACPAKGAFSASFGPKEDTSVTGHPLVFVN
jgi:hypothetical protein